MNDTTEKSNDQFWKKILALFSVGIVLFAAIYFGKQYKASQKIAEATEFYNQFSDETYINFAKKLEKSIHTKNPTEFGQYIDLASFFGFSARNLQQSYNKRTAIELLKPYFKIGNSISTQLINSTDFKFNKFYKKDGVPHVVFRLYRSDFINFMDFTLGIKQDTIVVTDMYVFYAGILFSEMGSEMYHKMMNQTQHYISELKTYQKVNSYIAIGNYEAAYNLLVSIPVEKRIPLHYQYLLDASGNYDIDKFIEVIKEMKKLKPNDKRLHAYLNLLENILSGDIETLNTAIVEIEKYVGEDIIFDLYRGLMYNLQSDYKKAVPFFDRLMKKAPDFKDGYFFKLYNLLTQRKTEEALILTAKIQEQFSISERELTFQIQEFQEFTNSEAYKNIFKSAE